MLGRKRLPFRILPRAHKIGTDMCRRTPVSQAYIAQAKPWTYPSRSRSLVRVMLQINQATLHLSQVSAQADKSVSIVRIVESSGSDVMILDESRAIFEQGPRSLTIYASQSAHDQSRTPANQSMATRRRSATGNESMLRIWSSSSVQGMSQDDQRSNYQDATIRTMLTQLSRRQLQFTKKQKIKRAPDPKR